jgi:hypothetical protein
LPISYLTVLLLTVEFEHEGLFPKLSSVDPNILLSTTGTGAVAGGAVGSAVLVVGFAPIEPEAEQPLNACRIKANPMIMIPFFMKISF